MRLGHNTIPIEQYGKNLRQLIARMKQTRAKLIFATTTPVPEYVQTVSRRAADVRVYNAVARKICEEEGVSIDDLYALALPRLVEIQFPNNVHFSPAGYEVLARHVAKNIGFLLDSMKR